MNKERYLVWKNYEALSAAPEALTEIVDSGAKNLLKITASSQTINGVTFTVNDDKTVTVNGTNTGTASALFTISELDLPANVTYSLSGCPSGGTLDTYYLGSLDIVNWLPFLTDIGAGASGGLTTAKTVRFRIGVRPGVTVSNLIFKPMLCTKAAWDISHQYVPYRPSYDELVASVEALKG